MLKSSKRMISTTHDQLSNVIHNTTTTQGCYQQQQQQHHHHYYHSDLIYRCSIKSKNNRPPKIRKRTRKHNRVVISKRQTRTTSIYRNNSNSKNGIQFLHSIQNDNNNNSTTTTTTTTLNSISKICVCACECRVNLEIFHQLSNYRKDICVYFEEKFINLQLVLVIILFALITCTAQNIDTQVKSQQKPVTSQTFLVTAFNDAASMTTISFNNTSHTIYCHHHHHHRTPSILNLPAGKGNNFNNPTKIISHYLRASRSRQQQQQQFKNESSHIKFNTRKISFGRSTGNKSNSLESSPANAHSKSADDDDTDDDANDHDAHNQDDEDNNDSSIAAISQIQQNNKNITKTIAIKLKNTSAKDDEQQQQKQQQQQTEIHNSNLIFFKNKYYIKSVSYTTNKTYSRAANKTKQQQHAQNAYNNINNHHSSDHDAAVKNFNTKLNLLLTSANRSPQFVNVDRTALLKIVLDGLGLQKVPNMASANISQLEYVTKYREYLQRVRSRKRRDLSQTEESVFNPLEILSITSTKLNRALKRPKRNVLAGVGTNFNYDYQDQEAENENYPPPSMEERVRNILFLKKKYQKPRSTKKERDTRKSHIRLMFAFKPEILQLKASDIEEANIRLILIHSPTLALKNSKNKKLHTKPKSTACGSNKSEQQKSARKQNVLNLKLFFLPSRGKRLLLDERKLDIVVDHDKPEETHTQWLQFDVTKAVKTAIDEKRLNHIVLELQCDNCKRAGARILNEAYSSADDALAHDNSTDDHQLMPVLNIIGHFDQSQHSVRTHQYEQQNGETPEEATNHRHYHHQAYNDNNNDNSQNRRNNCYKANQRCCRHSMEVTFKEIKGFEFIIQPKVFDAGYCHGRCPPRYNPAHHHALLQSLIWKQNHRKAPRPCCAPSKLVELEVLHVDEKDSNKLKISTWSDMKVVECACS